MSGSIHEAAVSDAGGAGGGVDAHLPECPEIPLLGLAVPVGVLHAVIQRVGGVTIQLGAFEAKALGGFDRANAAFARSG